jgi:hypothetical protein
MNGKNKFGIKIHQQIFIRPAGKPIQLVPEFWKSANKKKIFRC